MSCVSVLESMIDRQPILTWLSEQGMQTSRLTDLPGDVSLRRYMRAELDGHSAIVAVYPPRIRPACRRYLETTSLLSEVGVRVPRVIAHDCGLGLMVVEDAGIDTLYDLPDLDQSSLGVFFRHAIDNLERIQSLPSERVATLNPPLDADLLQDELKKTWDSLLAPLEIQESTGFPRALRGCLEELCRHLGSETPVPCHRDYMVRNLIPVEPHPTLVVIDHQDLRLGPPYYDLASILNDSLFPSPELEEEILSFYLGDRPQERTRYHRAAAQRTLKAVGTYETFAQRGFERHRKLISPTLDRSLRHLGRLPEASAVVEVLERHLRTRRIC